MPAPDPIYFVRQTSPLERFAMVPTGIMVHCGVSWLGEDLCWVCGQEGVDYSSLSKEDREAMNLQECAYNFDPEKRVFFP